MLPNAKVETLTFFDPSIKSCLAEAHQCSHESGKSRRHSQPGFWPNHVETSSTMPKTQCDTVIAFNVITHVQNGHAWLKDLLASVKPGGLLSFSNCHFDGTDELFWFVTTLSTRIKLKIFRVSVGMMARHGSEAWTLNEKTLKKLRGWCSCCLVSITGRTHREEAGADRLVRRHRVRPRPEAEAPRQHPAPERRREPEDRRHQAHQDGGRRTSSGVHIHGHTGSCGHTTTLRPRQRHGRVGQTHRRHLPDEEEQRHRAAQLIQFN